MKSSPKTYKKLHSNSLRERMYGGRGTMNRLKKIVEKETIKEEESEV